MQSPKLDMLNCFGSGFELGILLLFFKVGPRSRFLSHLNVWKGLGLSYGKLEARLGVAQMSYVYILVTNLPEQVIRSPNK